MAVTESDPAAVEQLPHLNLGQVRVWAQGQDGVLTAYSEGRKAAAGGFGWQEPLYAAMIAAAHQAMGQSADAVAEAEAAAASVREVSYGRTGVWPYATLARSVAVGATGTPPSVC